MILENGKTWANRGRSLCVTFSKYISSASPKARTMLRRNQCYSTELFFITSRTTVELTKQMVLASRTSGLPRCFSSAKNGRRTRVSPKKDRRQRMTTFPWAWVCGCRPASSLRNRRRGRGRPSGTHPCRLRKFCRRPRRRRRLRQRSRRNRSGMGDNLRLSRGMDGGGRIAAGLYNRKTWPARF